MDYFLPILILLVLLVPCVVQSNPTGVANCGITPSVTPTKTNLFCTANSCILVSGVSTQLTHLRPNPSVLTAGKPFTRTSSIPFVLVLITYVLAPVRAFSTSVPKAGNHPLGVLYRSGMRLTKLSTSTGAVAIPSFASNSAIFLTVP